MRLIATLLLLCLGDPGLGAFAQAAGQDPRTIVAGYAAKVAASAVFVGGRELESVTQAELRPGSPLERVLLAGLELDLDGPGGTVTARLGPQHQGLAVHRAGLGCALVAPERAASVRAQALAPRAPLLEPPVLPLGPRLPGVQRALNQWLPQADQGTRALVVLRGGRLVGEAYAEGFGPQSRHAGWSMAKTITGALVLLRSAQGRLPLDRPLVRALPLEGWDDGRAAITPRHMLQMSSGLRFEESYLDLTSDATRMLFGGEDVRIIPSASPLDQEPGRVWAYSSGTSNLLQGLLRSTFADLGAYHRWPYEALFEPAGLDSALLEADAGGTFVGSSFAWMTARDWARFGQLLLDDGLVYLDAERQRPRRVLPAPAVRLMRAPAPAALRGQHGAHLWLNAGLSGRPDSRRYPKLEASAFYLSGYEGQVVLVLPEASLVIARLGVTKGLAPFDVQGLALDVLSGCSE